jgi:hypothetical protein
MNKLLLGGIKGTHTIKHASIESLTIALLDNDAVFQNPRSRLLQQIQLHYLAVCRQVHSCSYLLFIFSKLLANNMWYYYCI